MVDGTVGTDRDRRACLNTELKRMFRRPIVYLNGVQCAPRRGRLSVTHGAAQEDHAVAEASLVDELERPRRGRSSCAEPMLA